MHDSSSGTDRAVSARAPAWFVVLLLVVGSVALACESRREFTVVEPGATRVLTILVRDETGSIRGAQLSENRMVSSGRSGVGLSNPVGQPNVVRVGWNDNGCGTAATLTVANRGDQLAISIEKAWTRCVNDMAVPHVVDLYFDRPVDAGRAEGSLTTAKVTPEPAAS
jgi:hypothetical protein